MINNNISFKPFSKIELLDLTTKRVGETKIGELIHLSDNLEQCKFAIIGINEDIGPQANGGLPGSISAFKSFIQRFLNVQSNEFLNGKEICVLGEVFVNEPFTTLEKARIAVEEIDDFVFKLVQPIVEKGIIPIVIGGGHNNAYPLIKSCYTSLNNAIDVVNLDPHADCRPLEGRHSGNSFSYAKEHHFLNHYSVIGLHESYNSAYIYNYLRKHNFIYTLFEDHLLDPLLTQKTIAKILENKEEKRFIGIELDLDAIAMMPSSAFTPSGFSIENARIYIQLLAQNQNICYLHLPEGAPSNQIEEKIVGKTLVYLVLDFIKTTIKSKQKHEEKG